MSDSPIHNVTECAGPWCEIERPHGHTCSGPLCEPGVYDLLPRIQTTQTSQEPKSVQA
jgi:hypothetical protein